LPGIDNSDKNPCQESSSVPALGWDSGFGELLHLLTQYTKMQTAVKRIQALPLAIPGGRGIQSCGGQMRDATT